MQFYDIIPQFSKAAIVMKQMRARLLTERQTKKKKKKNTNGTTVSPTTDD